MSWFYPKERKLTKNDIESYAHACYELLTELGIQDGHHKMYDPLTIEGNVAHSYVFDLEDGGRHHYFNDLGHLRKMILEETANIIKEDYENKKNRHY